MKTRFLEEFKEIEITPALQILLEERRAKTEQEVEQEFEKLKS